MKGVLAYALVMLLIELLYCVPAHAETFFESLYDVPVMPGLIEIPESVVVFDSVQGRIAEVEALTRETSMAQILAFYHAALPALGWTAKGGGVFLRDTDRLHIMASAGANGVIVHFSLSPSH